MSSVEELYPEHQKMMLVSEQSQAIGAFIDNTEYTLCKWNEELEQYVPLSGSINDVLAEYYEIDMAEIEREKRAMLATMTGG